MQWFFNSSMTLKLLGRKVLLLWKQAGHLGLSIRIGIPYIMLTSDFITAFASGMTVKLFPLFFKNEVHMTSSQVNSVNLISFSIMIIFTHLSGRVSSRFGRIQTILLAASCGIPLLILMGVLKNY